MIFPAGHGFCFAISRGCFSLKFVNETFMKKKMFAAATMLVALTFNVAAWDYEGHHAVNQLALASLPTNFPAFALTPEARTRIAFLAGEPDRWRNVTSTRNGTGLALGHCSGPDHYLDIEDLKHFDLKPETLPPFRYVFVAEIALARAAHPERFPAIDPAKNSDHTRELCGFLPWAINENFEKLQSGFATLAALETHGGTADEIANAKQNIIYVMGVMGHFVGDAAQPLHTTMYHHGWTTNDNPKHFSTSFKIHSWIDGDFFKKTGGVDAARLSPQIVTAQKLAVAAEPEGVFRAAVNFTVANNQLVEPLYQLDKDGKLSNKGDAGAAGRVFLESQMLKSAQLLGSIWLTAWLTAPEDTFLEKQLADRAAAAGASADKAK